MVRFHWHPRDVDRMTERELRTAIAVVEHMVRAEREAQQRG